MKPKDILQALLDQKGENPLSLSKKTRVPQPTLFRLLSGDTKEPRRSTLLPIAKHYGFPVEAFFAGKPIDFTSSASVVASMSDGGKIRSVVSEEDTDREVGRIPYWEARGSCGGGFLNYDQLPVGHLVKEATFFKRYGLKPAHAIAVYADGDSMSDFIVDGDIVIFDTSKTEPRTGKIFLIEHPDGLRIKQLRRDIDGSWVLESRNIDKREFPDERISPDHGERLKIHGEFVYRQGG